MKETTRETALDILNDIRQEVQLRLVRRPVSTWEINCPDMTESEAERNTGACKRD